MEVADVVVQGALELPRGASYLAFSQCEIMSDIVYDMFEEGKGKEGRYSSNCMLRL